jgi:hypothetical protein
MQGKSKLGLVKLVDNFDASYSYVANEGTVFYFQTNLNAPRYRCALPPLQLGTLHSSQLRQGIACR